MEDKHPNEYIIKAVFKKLKIKMKPIEYSSGFHFAYSKNWASRSYNGIAVQIGDSMDDHHTNNDGQTRYVYVTARSGPHRYFRYFDFPALEDPSFDPQTLIDEIVEFFAGYDIGD